MKASQDLRATSGAPDGSLPVHAPASVVCDLCEAPFQLPANLIREGRVYGLLTCSQCCEDNLATRQLETLP